MENNFCSKLFKELNKLNECKETNQQPINTDNLLLCKYFNLVFENKCGEFKKNSQKK
jgi:hypothetical protein